MKTRRLRRHGAPTVLVANPGADLYGSDRMVLESVSALRSAGHRVVVALPEDGPLVEELRTRGAEVEICPTPVLRKSLKSARGAISLLSDVLRRTAPMISLIRRVDPDVIYVNTITVPLWLLGAWLLRRPSVCHVHEGEATASRRVLTVLNLPLVLADRLIVNSKFSLGVLTGALPSLASKSGVVYNAVAGPIKEVGPGRLSLTDPVRVLYIGRLSPRKGPDVAIEAIGVLRAGRVSVRLDLVGAVFRGYEWFMDALETRVADQQLADLVTFHGFQRDVWPYIAAADIVVVPSVVDEPFGNTAVEAVLGARPLVVSDIAGLSEAAADMSAAVQVPPGDASAVAHAIRRVIEDWPAYRRRAVDDAAVARNRYSSEAYGRRIIEIVTSAMVSESRARSDWLEGRAWLRA